MKIGIDASFIYCKVGFGTYSYNLIKELIKLDRQNEYFLYYNELPLRLPIFKNIPENRKSEEIFLPSNFKLIETDYKLRLFWSRYWLPRKLIKGRISLFHSVDNISVPFRKKPYKIIITIHDIIPVLFPEYVKKVDQIFFELIYPRIFKIADLIITVSKNSKKDIIERYKVNEKKIVVIYNGCNHKKYKPIEDRELIKEICKKYGISSEYILCVTTISPRRNIFRLIQAYNKLINDFEHLKRFKLVIAGNINYRYKEIFNIVKKSELKDHIHFTGFVKGEDLPYLYNGAKLFVYPSLYEGFGLSVLEAMACSIPVVTSNISSIPEIVRDAALLVDPFSVESICKNIYNVLIDDSLHRIMRERGIEQAKKFSWEIAAKKTLEVYKSFC